MGASGIQQILKYEGTALVQEPETAEYEEMPMAAIRKNKSVKIRTPQEIVHCLLSLITPNSF
ncbi:chemotaxis protein CheB [Chitinophagaceae bacterium LWZ2-11]